MERDGLGATLCGRTFNAPARGHARLPLLSMSRHYCTLSTYATHYISSTNHNLPPTSCLIPLPLTTLSGSSSTHMVTKPKPHFLCASSYRSIVNCKKVENKHEGAFVCVTVCGNTRFIGVCNECISICMCAIISFKCVGCLSSASLGKAPGFPAPPGHLVPVTGSQLELCLCVSAEEPASSKHYCLIRFESRGPPYTNSVHVAPSPHTEWISSVFLETKREDKRSKKTTRNKFD